ncbi:MAG: hypothetical protein LBS33_01960 [Streptococcaceae bacterium]|jgi:hypothetical protein|nr:hypothetical protein [Streptococcaceae bacterium]
MPLDKLNEVAQKAKAIASDVAQKAKDVPDLAKDLANKTKTTVTSSAEKIYDISQNEHYRVEVRIDKNGVRKKLATNRPTRHTIKWRAKGY